MADDTKNTPADAGTIKTNSPAKGAVSAGAGGSGGGSGESSGLLNSTFKMEGLLAILLNLTMQSKCLLNLQTRLQTLLKEALVTMSIPLLSAESAK